MSTLFTVKQKCAVCGCEHDYPMALSTSSFGYADLDMRPPEVPRSCFEYEIQQCPRCHYANGCVEDLIPDCTWNTLQDPFYQKIVNDDIDATAKSYILAAYLHAGVDLFYEAGVYFLRAAWVFDDRSQQSLAVQQRKKAVACLTKFDNPFENRQIDMIIVDIYRRIGNFDEAKARATALLQKGVSAVFEKIFRFELSLIDAKDTARHSIGEIDVI